MLDKLYASLLAVAGLSFGGYILLEEIADQADHTDERGVDTLACPTCGN
ncbi:hypothetical protein [Rhodococcus opacus]|nr:hypothetical protein [Rhodococcus opacus]